MKEKVLEVLQESLPNIEFLSSDKLVDDGILDSLSIMEIVATLSTEFDINIPFEEIVEENFNSIDGLTAMVERLKK